MQKIPESQKEIKNFIQNLPHNPGIYKFYQNEEVPIYIGKAKNIRNRVSSYFQHSKETEKKVFNLMQQAQYLEVTVTNNELEALLLEQHQIKEKKPKYNSQFKDDKGYPWIKIEISKKFPAAKSFLGKKQDNEKYFGPYPSSKSVQTTLRLIQKNFKLRNCSDSFFKNRTRPCIQYQIGRCSAPCVKSISQRDYVKEVKSAELLLEGKSDELISNLHELMQIYSEKKLYEKASIYRDKISNLRDIQRTQSISGFKKERDALVAVSNNGQIRVGVTHVNKGWITGHENFISKNQSLEESTLEAFIKGHYLSSRYCPDTLILEEFIEDKASIEDALSQFHEKKIRMIIKPTMKDKGLLQICRANTELAFKRRPDERLENQDSLKALKRFLNLEKEIDLIESYDISHHGGEGAVSGCVVYGKLGRLQDRYRLYNISSLNSRNDIGAIREVLRKRFNRSSPDLDRPDLILIDGGKAHLKAAFNELIELDINDVEIISISKGTRRKMEFDSIHTNDGSTHRVKRGSLSHLFLQELRDETHRFGVSNQKKKQRKLSLKSSLDAIEGIGSKKKISLINYFGSVKQIERASVQDLLKVKGIGPILSLTIYNTLH